MPQLSNKLIKQIEECLDDLIHVIDHDRDSIDDYTTESARKLLIVLSEKTN